MALPPLRAFEGNALAAVLVGLSPVEEDHFLRQIRPRVSGERERVDDETAILELGTYILEQRGYTVLPAPTPTKALALALEHRGTIDLLITDVIMPEINGRELAKEILIIRPEIKVLFISGYTSDILNQNGGLESGMHFLEKPFSASNLGKIVREVIDQNRYRESGMA